MQHRYVHLIVAHGWDIVVPLGAVSRLLHRQDPDYGLWAPQARSLASALGVKPASDLPGVLAVLADGACWHAGDARLGGGGAESYLSAPPWVFAQDPAWCRGVLLREGSCSFVADPASLGGLGG